MAQLAGKFAGIVVASVPDSRTDELIAALRPLEERGLLDISVDVAAPDAARAPAAMFDLELLGQDRLGIIAEMSHALAEISVSIDELWTEVREAPMAGGLLFEARAELSAPDSVDAAAIAAALADLEREFEVSLTAKP